MSLKSRTTTSGALAMVSIEIVISINWYLTFCLSFCDISIATAKGTTKLYDNARIGEASTWISAGKSRRYSHSIILNIPTPPTVVPFSHISNWVTRLPCACAVARNHT